MRLPTFAGALMATLFGHSLLWSQAAFTGCNGAAASGRLTLQVLNVDAANGAVQVTGGDSRGPGTPFTWSWGDGAVTATFFPASHTYSSTQVNYALQVTAHENDGSSDCAQIAITFQPGLPAGKPATIPQIGSFSPVSANAGSPAQTLTIHGVNFLSTSTVTFDGIPHPAAFIDSATISVNLTASDQSVGGFYDVVVTNPPPYGGAAQTYFAVRTPETPGTWRLLGPHHINGKTGLLESGKIQAFVAAPDLKTLFAAGGLGSGNEGPLTGSGVFKSVDAGSHWTSVNNGLTDTVVDTLWMAPSNANIVLAGTDNDGIFRTTDGGASWTRVANSGTSDFVSTNGKVLAAGSDGVLQSSDLGATWTLIKVTASRVRALASSGMAVLAGLDDGTLLMRASEGEDFQTVMTNSKRSVWSVAIDPASPAKTFAVLGLGPNPPQLAASTDGGRTWALTTTPNTPQAVAVAADHSIYVGGDDILLVSHDSGISWQTVPDAVWDVRRIYLQPGPFSIVLGTDQGLHASADGLKTWTSLTGAVPSSILSGVAVRDSTLLTAVQDFSPILTFDNGANWTQPVWGGLHPPVGEDGAVVINPGNPQYCYVFTTAGFQYSADGGRTWLASAIPSSQGISYEQPGNANIIAVDPAAPAIVYAAAGDAVYRSQDFGVNFAKTAWGIGHATAIALSPADSRIVLVGTLSGLMRSTDGGTTWKAVTLPGSGYPLTIAFDPQDRQTVVAGSSQGPGQGGGIFKSTDAGATFHLSNSGLFQSVRGPGCFGREITALSFDPTGALALATNVGVYYSGDAGDSWRDITNNLAATCITGVTWDGGYLYAATFGAGVARTQPIATSPGSSVEIQAVVNGASFTSPIAPNTWITIRGSNLAQTTRVWGAGDFVNGRLPLSLDGVSVSVNSQPAFIYFISPAQLNVLSPDDTTQGPVSVVVTNGQVSSRAFSAAEAAVSPALFLFNAEFAASIHIDGNYVAPVNLFPGVSSSPAQPGETIILYGTGFGQTNPPFVAGSASPAVAPLAGDFALTIGGVRAAVSFAGIVSPGLYQVNVTVPDIPDGNAEVVASIGGFSSPGGISIPVHR